MTETLGKLAGKAAEMVENGPNNSANPRKCWNGVNGCEEIWFKNLVAKGTLQEHDFGVGDELEIDEELVKKGQEYFNRNFFSVLVNMLIGLYSLMFVPTIVRILYLTGYKHSLIQWFKSQD